MRTYQIEQFVSHSKSRRRGQALLLSVLVMIFIVLLGTTFIAIVASNMSNTARTGSKDEARQAAKAGIEFADSELTGSDDGLDWRPDRQLAIYAGYTSTNPQVQYFYDNSSYYDQLDRAQGWSNPATFNPDTLGPHYFVKYPNPTSGAQPTNTGKFHDSGFAGAIWRS